MGIACIISQTSLTKEKNSLEIYTPADSALTFGGEICVSLVCFVLEGGGICGNLGGTCLFVFANGEKIHASFFTTGAADLGGAGDLLVN